MQIIKIDQRTPEWHAWRNGADLADGKPRMMATAVSIAAGNSPFKTPHALWREMTLRAKPAEGGFAAQKGARKEDTALAAYMKKIGFRVAPACIQSDAFPWAGASLDGLNIKRKRAAEFKCNSAEKHDMASRGEIPDYYRDQISWQFFVGEGAFDRNDYWSFPWSEADKIEQTGFLVAVYPDALRMNHLFEVATAFRKKILDDIPPYSSEWEFAARSWRLAHDKIKNAEEELASAVAQLLSLLPANGKQEGGGVSASLTKPQKGRVDAKLAIEKLFTLLSTEKGIDRAWIDAIFAKLQEESRGLPGAPGFKVSVCGEISAMTSTASNGVKILTANDDNEIVF